MKEEVVRMLAVFFAHVRCDLHCFKSLLIHAPHDVETKLVIREGKNWKSSKVLLILSVQGSLLKGDLKIWKCFYNPHNVSEFDNPIDWHQHRTYKVPK